MTKGHEEASEAIVNRYVPLAQCTDKDQSLIGAIIRVEEIAKKKGVSMAQVAIAWMLAQDVVRRSFCRTAPYG